MNAITVNYAEVGDDHIPISFGLGITDKLTGETVYNSKITEINNTYSILQGRDIGIKDIIVSSNSKIDRLLSNFTSGATGWIQHRIPESDKTAYIFYKDDGYYYKMVEDENGRPVQAKYAPYAHLTNVKDNAGIQPYCEAEIETPVTLQVSAGSVKAVIGNTPVEIASVSSSLSLQLENANDDNFTSQSVTDSEYTIGSDFNLENTEWTRDGKSVPSWLSGNKIVKSSKTVNGMVNQIKQLAGNNLVKIFRKRLDYNVEFNFNGNATFDTVGTYCNGKEESSFNSGTKTLVIPNVKYGRTLLQYSDFFGGIIDGTVFSPVSIPNPFNGNSGKVTVTINVTDTVDYIRFTGWRGNSLVTEDLPFSHGYINQQPTQYRPDINLAYLSRIDVTGNGGLLTWKSANIFERHRQVYHRKYERTNAIGDFDKNCKQTINETIVDDSISVPKYDYEKGAVVYKWKEYWDYSQENLASKTFVATAHYNNIPAAVQVTAPNNPAAANSNQVVLFEGAYYVADSGMKSLVESLVSGVTVTVQKEIVKNVAWDITTIQKYYKMDTTTTEDGTDTTYTTKRAKITISGISSQVTSVESSDPNLTAQLTNQVLSGTDINITIHYEVPDGYSLSNTDHQLTLDVYSSIPATDWNKTVTYKFFD